MLPDVTPNLGCSVGGERDRRHDRSRSNDRRFPSVDGDEDEPCLGRNLTHPNLRHDDLMVLVAVAKFRSRPSLILESRA